MEEREDLILLKQISDKMDELNKNIERLVVAVSRQGSQAPSQPAGGNSGIDIGAQVKAKIEEARRQAEAQFGNMGAAIPPGFGVK